MTRKFACPKLQAEQACLTHSAVLQIQTHLEGPIGIALYEWKDGQIGAASIQGGKLLLSPRDDSLSSIDWQACIVHASAVHALAACIGKTKCAGPKGEGGLDDATGAGGTGASRMTQTSATVDLGEVLLESPDTLIAGSRDCCMSEHGHL